MNRVKIFFAMVLALLVFPVTSVSSLWANIPRVPSQVAPMVIVQASKPVVTMQQKKFVAPIVRNKRLPKQVLLAYNPMPQMFGDVVNPLAGILAFEPQQTATFVPSSAECSKYPNAETRARCEAVARELESINAEAAKMKAEIEAAERANQAELEKKSAAAKAEAERQARERLNQRLRQAERTSVDELPTLFGKAPAVTVEQDMYEGSSVTTSIGVYVILPPTENEPATVTTSFMELAIRKLLAGNRAKEFSDEYLKATETKHRSEQEKVLKAFDLAVANFKMPDELFDPAEVAWEDSKEPPPDFPKAPKSKLNPEGYTVITHFGSNRNRMGDPVNNFAGFKKNVLAAVEGIANRLHTCESNPQVQAELISFFVHTAQMPDGTAYLDPSVAREDWTRNHPFRECSMGSGFPLKHVWFKADKVGMTERGILWKSRISGDRYFINYRCGLNIDKLPRATKAKPKYVGTYKVDVVENYDVCEQVTVPGKTPIRKDELGRNVYSIASDETVQATVSSRQTGPNVKTKAAWLWALDGRPYDHEGQATVPVSGSSLTGKEAALDVSSTLPKDEQMKPNERKYCSVVFVLSEAKADCEQFGKATLTKDNLYISIPRVVTVIGDMSVDVIYTLNGVDVSADQVRVFPDHVEIPVNLVQSKSGQVVGGVRVVDTKTKKVWATCSGTAMPGVEIPGVLCASVTKRFDVGNKIRVSAQLTGNEDLVKELRWYLDGVLVQATRLKSASGVWEYTFPDPIVDESEHFVSVEVIGLSGQRIGEACNDRTPGTGLKKTLHCSCDKTDIAYFKNPGRVGDVPEKRKTKKMAVKSHDTQAYFEINPHFVVDETGQVIPIQEVKGDWERIYHTKDGHTYSAPIENGHNPFLKFRAGELVDAKLEKEEGNLKIMRSYLPSEMHKHHPGGHYAIPLGLGLLLRAPLDQRLIRTVTEFRFKGITSEGKVVTCSIVIGVKKDWGPFVYAVFGNMALAAGIGVPFVFTPAGIKPAMILIPW